MSRSEPAARPLPASRLRSLPALAIGALIGAFVVGGIAAAQDGPPRHSRGPHAGPPAMMRDGHRGPPFCERDMASRLEGMIALIDPFLGLTELQRAAWETLTADLGAASAAMARLCDTVIEAPPPATVPEATARAETLAVTAAEQVRTLRGSIDAFYATLDDRQKAALDQFLAERMQARHELRGGRAPGGEESPTPPEAEPPAATPAAEPPAAETPRR